MSQPTTESDADADADADDESGRETEPVMVIVTRETRGNKTYHYDESCRCVKRMHATQRKPRAAVVGHYHECTVCGPGGALR